MWSGSGMGLGRRPRPCFSLDSNFLVWNPGLILAWVQVTHDRPQEDMLLNISNHVSHQHALHALADLAI